MNRWTRIRSRRLKALLVGLVLSGQLIGYDRHVVVDEIGRISADFIGSNPCFQKAEGLAQLEGRAPGRAEGVRSTTKTLEVLQVEKTLDKNGVPMDMGGLLPASLAPAPAASSSLYKEALQAIPPPHEAPVVPFLSKK